MLAIGKNAKNNLNHKFNLRKRGKFGKIYL